MGRPPEESSQEPLRAAPQRTLAPLPLSQVLRCPLTTFHRHGRRLVVRRQRSVVEVRRAIVVVRRTVATSGEPSQPTTDRRTHTTDRCRRTTSQRNERRVVAVVQRAVAISDEPAQSTMARRTSTTSRRRRPRNRASQHFHAVMKARSATIRPHRLISLRFFIARSSAHTLSSCCSENPYSNWVF